jgi:hypothetical protein
MIAGRGDTKRQNEEQQKKTKNKKQSGRSKTNQGTEKKPWDKKTNQE